MLCSETGAAGEFSRDAFGALIISGEYSAAASISGAAGAAAISVGNPDASGSANVIVSGLSAGIGAVACSIRFTICSADGNSSRLPASGMAVCLHGLFSRQVFGAMRFMVCSPLALGRELAARPADAQHKRRNAAATTDNNRGAAAPGPFTRFIFRPDSMPSDMITPESRLFPRGKPTWLIKGLRNRPERPHSTKVA